jgi:uncharacterized protein
MAVIGIISDTHGLLRPQAAAALQRSAMIVHAGDVGAPEVLAGLSRMAPVVAVRGNIDEGSWADALPLSMIVNVKGRSILVVHDLDTFEHDPEGWRPDAVIFGHSHQPVVETRNGVLYVNPGSAGPRRFRLPVAVAKLYVSARGLSAHIHELAV